MEEKATVWVARGICGLFLALLCGCGLWVLLTPDAEASYSENRTLQTRPPITWSHLLNGKAQSRLTDWFSDQFPGRDGLMALRTGLLRLLGRQDSGGVYFGRDHYYFEKLTGDAFNAQRYARNLASVAAFAAAHSELPTTVLLAPSSGVVNAALLPAHADYYDAEAMYALAQQTLAGCTVLDLRQAFAAARSDTQLYYRTDHHWTTRGAFLAYQAFAASAGLPAPAAPDFTAVSDSFLGTLHSKTLDPAALPDTLELAVSAAGLTATADGQEIPVYDYTALDAKDQYQIFFGGNYGLLRLCSDAPGGKTLLVLKDSYANCFAPFLTQQYATVLLVDLRYYGGDLEALLAQEQPERLLVLYEMSRFAEDTALNKLAQ